MKTLNELLKPMKVRVEKATRGPWKYEEDKTSGPEFGFDDDNGVLGRVFTNRGQEQNDVEFIAHSRSDVERLLACVERLYPALEGLTNAALADLMPLQSQVNEAFEALAEAGKILQGEEK